MRTKILVSMAALLFSIHASARVNCPPAIVIHIQIEDNKVLYLQNNAPWRRLGGLDDPGTKERMSALLAAQMSGKRVGISYRDETYDCTATNYSVSAYLLKTYND